MAIEASPKISDRIDCCIHNRRQAIQRSLFTVLSRWGLARAQCYLLIVSLLARHANRVAPLRIRLYTRAIGA